MKQYIDKNKLLEELKKLKQNLSASPIVVIEDVESLVESLEVKEMDNIWHIASETDLPKVGDVVCLIKDGRIISGEYRANKFYGKVCDGYDNSLEKGDKWCYLYGDLLKAEHLKKENEL